MNVLRWAMFDGLIFYTMYLGGMKGIGWAETGIEIFFAVLCAAVFIMSFCAPLPKKKPLVPRLCSWLSIIGLLSFMLYLEWNFLFIEYACTILLFHSIKKKEKAEEE